MRKFLSTLAVTALTAFSACVVHAQSSVDENEIADTLERSKARNKLIACADPYSFPASTRGEPAGFDVEIMREIAKLGGMSLFMEWVDTGTRGGTGRAFRNSILKKKCDVFLGLSDSGEDDMLMGELEFSKPYLGMGYILIVQGKAADKKTLAEMKDANIKVGVPMSTPIDDYLNMNDIPRSLYLDNRRIMRGMAAGEVDASLVWGTAFSVARKEFPDAKFQMVSGYVPEAGQRWNLNFVVRKQDKALMEFINKGIDELLANGKIKQVVERYDVPFYAPFS